MKDKSARLRRGKRGDTAMKISVFYEHIEKACEQTKKPLEEVLAHVKKSGIDGIEMDYDMLSSNDDEQSILTFLKKAGVHCHHVPESMR